MQDDPPARLDVLQSHTKNLRERTARLVSLALRGLPQMYADGSFVHTVRAVHPDMDMSVRPEGENLRYAAIVALGAAFVDHDDQRRILGGRNAAEFARSIVGLAALSEDTGAIALTAWAAAEVAGFHAADLFARLRAVLAANEPVSTVECAWTVIAALAARHLADTDDLCLAAANRLRLAQSPSGLFPHMLPAEASGRFRAHVGCFADQVYPIQALARFSVAYGDKAALAAADSCAARICACQGPAGQWWWHYDTRDGTVVEGYPVYSVHQHAMAPMALLDLAEAGGHDHRQAIGSGLMWLYEHPEVSGDLICEESGVIWRKVGRREPAKAVRKISAVTTALSPGLHLSGLEAIFPPTRIDYECRPYELGWLLYAWLSGGVVQKLRGDETVRIHARAPQPVAQNDNRRLLFGLYIDPLRMEEVVERCRAALTARSPLLLGVLNAAKVVKLRKDPALRTSLLECDLLLADGQSVVWASKLLGRPLPERVTGIDIFERLLGLAHREGWSIYLLGAKPDVLRTLEERLQERYPGLKIAGRNDGYFADEDGSRIAADIRKSGADMLFLGMSSPKKEIFLGSFKDSLDVPVLHGVGGSFDILAGITKRAPVGWQRFGMEWAFRLLQEPRRMAWRYLSTNAEFLLLTAREFFGPSPPFRGAVTHVVLQGNREPLQ
ncbi:WecB/TagA/CpsF family glycosyltransferase [Microvirga flavescens]|uniref:WecB/TagA/CpsF family glycosyltransferase n=1 Tax=Microvirga flavescens TaxID=2249811 RepID=UPI001FE225CF|nr:WecB/TagA/CpsF family glycosyltransferase [Microvirga flavescens]